jgi:hypothetical protein
MRYGKRVHAAVRARTAHYLTRCAIILRMTPCLGLTRASRLDNVDICVGNFWETPERRKLVRAHMRPANTRSHNLEESPIQSTPRVHLEQVPFSSQMFADNMRIVSLPRGFKAKIGEEKDVGGVVAFDWSLLYLTILRPFSAETW